VRGRRRALPSRSVKTYRWTIVAIVIAVAFLAAVLYLLMA
jgi:hypothetical protein